MKHLKIKNLILAAALAVGLGVTGISATAQAAGASVLSKDECDHPEDKWKYQIKLISYDVRDNNRFTHTKYTMRIFTCGICNYIIGEDVVTEEEPHTLVNSSGNRWECVYCNYSE